ncbi:MAG: undecaprenyl-diphosphate phosphatase [Xanthobacteraceae bacterium]
MTLGKLLEALLLGLLEGGTEFIPVSSTGHLLLATHFLKFETTGKSFEVLVQLGAILGVVVVYFMRLAKVAFAVPFDPAARRFALGIILAFIPAAVAGVLLHGFIKTVLFESPMVIAIALIVGGIILLFVDKIAFNPKYDDAMALPPLTAFGIGLFQCLALVPGVSRSGSTIVGALLLGLNRKAAAEFSFFLAMPTMLGAFTYDLAKNYKNFTLDDGVLVVVGFVAAFCAALVVVRAVLDYVSRNGFALFGWWRIIVGSAALIGLYVTR